MNRDEYVRKLKEQIDQWNAQVAKWEAMSEEVKNKYLQQLDEVQVRREEAMQELKRNPGRLYRGVEPDEGRHRGRVQADAPRRSRRASKAFQKK
jgi:hypothetical protein